MAGYAGRTQAFGGSHDNVCAIVFGRWNSAGSAGRPGVAFRPDAVWAETSERIAAEADIRLENLLFSVVHDHGAPAPRTCQVRTRSRGVHGDRREPQPFSQIDCRRSPQTSCAPPLRIGN